MLEQGADHKRAAFPAVSPDAAALGNCLIARSVVFDAAIMGETRRFDLVGATAAPGASCITFRCNIGECDVLVSIDDDQAQQLLPRLAANVVLNDLPTPLVMAVAEAGLRPVIKGLAAYLGLPSSLDMACEGAPADWPRLSVCENGSDTSIASLHVAPETIEEFTTALAASPPRASWRGVDSVLVKVNTQLWRTTMRAGDVADLNCGDVVLLPEGYPADRVVLIAADMRKTLGIGRRNGALITIEELKRTATAEQSGE